MPAGTRRVRRCSQASRTPAGLRPRGPGRRGRRPQHGRGGHGSCARVIVPARRAARWVASQACRALADSATNRSRRGLDRGRRSRAGWPAERRAAASRPRPAARPPPPAAPRRAGRAGAARAAPVARNASSSPSWNPARQPCGSGAEELAEVGAHVIRGVAEHRRVAGDAAHHLCPPLARHLGGDRRPGQAGDLGGHRVERRGDLVQVEAERRVDAHLEPGHGRAVLRRPAPAGRWPPSAARGSPTRRSASGRAVPASENAIADAPRRSR